MTRLWTAAAVAVALTLCGTAAAQEGGAGGTDAGGAGGQLAQGGAGGGGEVVDADQDGYASDVDCRDDNASVHPNAYESCNGIDDNCDGYVDENCGDYDDAGPTPTANMVSGLLLAAWLGFSAWRRRRNPGR